LTEGVPDFTVEQIFGQQVIVADEGSWVAEGSAVGSLGMLASAMGGRPLVVAAIEPGQPAWTDGTTVYIDAAANPQDRLESLAVQTSLLAVGGLEPAILRRLARRQTVADRYLAVEGRRALSENGRLLPTSMLSRLDIDEGGNGSPAGSLAIAESRALIDDPPTTFGVIRAGRLLAAHRVTAKAAAAAARHAPHKQSYDELPDLPEDLDDQSAQDSVIADLFSSSVGGGGAIGKLFARLMTKVRQVGGSGPPGADAATHAKRSATRGASAVVSSLTPASDGDGGDDIGSGGVKYPEWDVNRKRYRPDWCTVRETEARHNGEGWATPDGHALRRSLTRLGMGMSRHHRQLQGDDIDVDAAVEMRVELAAGSAADDAVYLDNLRRRRDLSVLILLDVSGSAGEAGTAGRTVHEQQLESAAALTAALHELGDRVALFAYYSQGRSAVNLTPIKRFDNRFDTAAMRRLYGLKPGAYSRLGAAIRHGTAILRERGGTPRRLLVVLSDGLAYDHGYERTYGAADARRALGEAGRQGIGCLCLTVGAATDVDELRRVFGTAAHAAVGRPEQLSRVIGPLFRVALNRAEMRRRKA
jgi:nitric oxide reductase NorD protein